VAVEVCTQPLHPTKDIQDFLSSFAHIGRMVTVNYIVFVFVAAVVGSFLGFCGHFARAHLTYTPEELFDGGVGTDLINDMFSAHSLTFEKHVIGAKWDANGYWDSENNRNLIYYCVSGFVAPIIIGALFWSDRAKLMSAVCHGLLKTGLHPPLC
jgi:hypothetical protein